MMGWKRRHCQYLKSAFKGIRFFLLPRATQSFAGAMWWNFKDGLALCSMLRKVRKFMISFEIFEELFSVIYEVIHKKC